MVSKFKQLMADELAGRYAAGTDYLVVGYTGLKGPETTELRRKLRERQVRMEVVKNSIVRRVLEAGGLGAGAQFFDGASALITGTPDMPELCKLVTDLARDYEKRLTVRGGLFEGVAMDRAAVRKLAAIPPMPVLQAQMIGSIYGQLAGVASAFQSIARSLVCALEGIREVKLEQAG